MPASTLLLVDFGWTDAREVPQFSTRKRRVAGRPWAGVRPARPKGSHKHYPFLSNSSSAYSSSPPAESSNERRRVAVRHLPGRRTARLCEPQEHSQQVQPYRLSGSKPAGFGVETGSKRRCASLRGGRLRPAQPYGSQEHCLFIFGRSQRRTNIKAEAASKRRCASPPHPGAAEGRPLTRELSYSLSPHYPGKSTAQSTAQISAPCSARRDAKTVIGFRARRTGTAQSSPQFSAPCPPYCGSAFAPPRFRAPWEILSKRASTF